ncbi:hypothetical protein B0H17DRAFT_1213203 [Mycena rosella]|uniref:Uncharacterized protein n=1 Tax=Mycena rosella TaxID=1033263 RepID=A0AAD7CT37_MYCRO|nr:hypothetical protein B0H17DRAFT_1213203 [Mycena rosella]
MSSAASTGLAVLENPRIIPKTKTVVFDLQACLSSSEPALIGSVRYLHRDNLDFPEVGCYAAWISVARTLPTVEVYSQDLGPMDYHVIGDAVWTFCFSQPAFVQMCGLATNPDKDDGTFEVIAEQYVTATRSAECFPICCLIPDTPRFHKYKPISSKGKFVSVTGFLTGIERNDDHTVKHFLLDVDQVVFLGQSASAPKDERSPNKIASGTPARLKFTGFLGSQGTDIKSGEPPSKKRKTADDRTVEEAADKGEVTAQGRRGDSRNTQ